MKLIIAPTGSGKTFVIRNRASFNIPSHIDLKDFDEYQSIRDLYRHLVRDFGQQWWKFEEAHKVKNLVLACNKVKTQSETKFWLTAERTMAKYATAVGVWLQSANVLYSNHLARKAEGNFSQPIFTWEEILEERQRYAEFASSEGIPISDDLDSLI